MNTNLERLRARPPTAMLTTCGLCGDCTCMAAVTVPLRFRWTCIFKFGQLGPNLYYFKFGQLGGSNGHGLVLGYSRVLAT